MVEGFSALCGTLPVAASCHPHPRMDVLLLHGRPKSAVGRQGTHLPLRARPQLTWRQLFARTDEPGQNGQEGRQVLQTLVSSASGSLRLAGPAAGDDDDQTELQLNARLLFNSLDVTRLRIMATVRLMITTMDVALWRPYVRDIASKAHAS